MTVTVWYVDEDNLREGRKSVTWHGIAPDEVDIVISNWQYDNQSCTIVDESAVLEGV